jgi:hypothetical protein
MKTYSGKYKVKNPAKYKGDYTNVVYRSMWERQCFAWCENNSEIKEWSSEEIVVPYFYDVDKKYHRYFIDLKITFNNGQTILVEVKPEKETAPPKRPDKSKRYINESLTYVKNMNKWLAAHEFAKDRGWEFQVWTEKTLEKLNILPKAFKPLKPIKKIKK